jgi:hypothetical protein
MGEASNLATAVNYARKIFITNGLPGLERVLTDGDQHEHHLPGAIGWNNRSCCRSSWP